MSLRKLRSLTGTPPTRSRTSKETSATTSSTSYSSGSESDSGSALSSSESVASLSSSLSRADISDGGSGGPVKLSNRDKIKRQLSWRGSKSRLKKEKETSSEKKENERGSGDEKQGRKRSNTKLHKMSDKEMKEGKLDNLRQAGESALDNISVRLTEIEREIESRQKIDDQLKEKVSSRPLLSAHECRPRCSSDLSTLARR